MPSIEPSQGDIISYDDPAGRMERERILAQLKAASPSQDVEQDFQPVQVSRYLCGSIFIAEIRPEIFGTLKNPFYSHVSLHNIDATVVLNLKTTAHKHKKPLNCMLITWF